MCLKGTEVYVLWRKAFADAATPSLPNEATSADQNGKHVKDQQACGERQIIHA
jgi:hypothetical protein